MAKRSKVGEAQAPYLSPKNAAKGAPKRREPSVRYLDQPTTERLADKIFSERRELLRKLAQ